MTEAEARRALLEMKVDESRRELDAHLTYCEQYPWQAMTRANVRKMDTLRKLWLSALASLEHG